MLGGARTPNGESVSFLFHGLQNPIKALETFSWILVLQTKRRKVETYLAALVPVPVLVLALQSVAHIVPGANFPKVSSSPATKSENLSGEGHKQSLLSWYCIPRCTPFQTVPVELFRILCCFWLRELHSVLFLYAVPLKKYSLMQS